jgi:hypothetical protein
MAKLRKSSPAAHRRNSKPLADRSMMRTLSISNLNTRDREEWRERGREQSRRGSRLGCQAACFSLPAGQGKGYLRGDAALALITDFLRGCRG